MVVRSTRDAGIFCLGANPFKRRLSGLGHMRTVADHRVSSEVVDHLPRPFAGQFIAQWAVGIDVFLAHQTFVCTCDGIQPAAAAFDIFTH